MDEPTLGTTADSVTVEIVNAVAEETDRSPKALPSLYDVVDPDALNALMTPTPNMTREASDVEVSFEFADCTVTVSSADGVDVATGAAAPPGDAPIQTVDD